MYVGASDVLLERPREAQRSPERPREGPGKSQGPGTPREGLGRAQGGGRPEGTGRPGGDRAQGTVDPIIPSV